MPFEPFEESELTRSVTDRFDDIARRYADRLAVSDPARSLTYAELAGLAERIAASLAGALPNRSAPVAILLPNEARYPAAMLGALAAGHPYVPLDADHPLERNRQIAEHAGAAAVISAGDMARRIHGLFPKPLPVLDIDRLESGTRADPARRPGPDHVAYITYTSGSTGRPKGVFQNHRGLLHDILQATNTLQRTSDDRLCMFYSPSLLHGTRLSFAALLNGASVHMLSPRELQPAGLARELRARGITNFSSVPALFRRVVESLGSGEKLDSLRLVFLGGDRVGWHDHDAFKRGCRPDSVFGVHLSSTECSTTFLQWMVDDGIRASSPQLPVGRPLPDRAVELFDADGHPVADGQVGELAVTSRYVALGYWNDPDLTAKAFTPDPADPLSRRFRTGDMARRRPDGLFEFLGRKDQQVKIAGHRVEPGEIEGVLESFSGIRCAAVVVRKDQAGIARSLAAYVEPEPGVQGLLPRHVMSMASRALPAYMTPSTVYVDELPRMSNFKLDRKRIEEMDTARDDGSAERGNNAILDDVTVVFEQVLEVSGATADDYVRSLGGDSLQAVAIAAALERRFGIMVPPEQFEAFHSIRELANWLHERKERPD